MLSPRLPREEAGFPGTPWREYKNVKILVPVKRVIDYNVRIRVRRDGSGVETANVKMSMNPFCEIAVEEAMRLREAGAAAEFIVVTIGDEQCRDVLRTALAMGADRAILVKTDAAPQSPDTARLLQAVVEREQPELVIAGKQAIDDDNNQVGQMLAARLGWAQATFASRVEPAGRELKVTREVDGGLETVAAALPVVVTTDLRLNEPRYVKLPDIMKARKKPLDATTPAELGVTLAPDLEVLQVTEPPTRAAGVMVADVRELADKLRHEAKVI